MAQKYLKAAAATLAGTAPPVNIAAAKFTRNRSSKSFRFGSINLLPDVPSPLSKWKDAGGIELSYKLVY